MDIKYTQRNITNENSKDKKSGSSMSKSTSGFTPTPLITKRYARSDSQSEHRNERCRGFTIIELLVVVAIIAILAGIGLSRFSSAQAKSRDAERISTVREIQKALDLYFADNNVFPIYPTEVTITGEDDFSTTLESAGTISQITPDPQHPDLTYSYQSNSTGTTYNLNFCLETPLITSFSEGCGNTITP